MLPVPFVGNIRSQILERGGYTLAKIKEASPEELAALDGFSLSLAKNIIKYSYLVKPPKALPKELNFKEFRCPSCGAVVSEAEPVCHKCGHVFFEHPDNYQELMDKLAKVIADIYHDPRNPKLWREGANILHMLGNEVLASDFKFKAGSLELDTLESSASKDRLEISTPIKIPKSVRSPHTNGLVNGLVNGLTFNVPESRKPEPRRKLSVLIIGLIILVPILMAGILTVGSAPAIVIDGHFGDWRNIASHGGYSSFFTSLKMKTYGENTFIYVQGAKLFSAKNFRFGILIDQDSNNKTGYPVNHMGVDCAVWIYTVNGSKDSNVFRFENKNWVSVGKADFAISGNAIELKTLKINAKSSVLLYYSDFAGEEYSSVYTYGEHVWGVSAGGTTLSPGKEVENVTLWNSGVGTVNVSSLSIKNLGNTTAKIKIEFESMSQVVTLGEQWENIALRTPIKIGTSPKTMKIIYVDGGRKYGTISVRMSLLCNFTFVNRAAGAYVSAIPAQKAIDGIFLDWYNAHKSPRSNLPENIDLSRYGTDNSENLKIYMSVYGTLFGVGVPVINTGNGNSTGGNITNSTELPQDTVEIYVDTDKNSHTGYKIGNIGAEYKFLVYGKLGTVIRIQAYRWLGAWVAMQMPVKYAKNDNSMEIGLPVKGNVYYRLVNWEGIWDKTITPPQKAYYHSGSEGKIFDNNSSKIGVAQGTPINVTCIGKYNITELRAIFGTDVQVTTSTDDESRPTIAITTDGTLWITYNVYSSTSDYIYFANSTDGGATWTVYSLTGVKTYNDPNSVIISDSANNVYIFWENHTSGAYFTYLEYLNSSKGWEIVSISTWTWWDSVTNLSAATYTYGSDIYIYVVFEYIYSSTDHDVGYVKTWNGGATWYEDYDSSTSIAYTSNWEGHPSVSFSTGTTPKVFVAYDVYDGNYWNVTVKNNTDINGTSWSGEIFSDTGYNIAYPSVYGTGDDIYVVFELEYTSTDHDIGLFNTTDNGVTWKWGSWAASTTDDERYPSVVANGADVYLFYLNATTGYICEKESTDYGQTWSNVDLVSDQGSGVAIYRTVYAYYYNGKLYVVWTDNRNGNDDIYFDSAAVPEINQPLILFVALIFMVFFRGRSSRKHKNLRPHKKDHSLWNKIFKNL